MATTSHSAPKAAGNVANPGSGGTSASATAAELRAQADALDASAAATYSPDELKKFVGDLKPGEVGWVALDEHGEPSGAPTREPPEGKPAARIVHNVPNVVDEVTTPTGAPITKHMNPIPELWDEGMKQRNPIPGSAQPPASTSAPAGEHSASAASTSTAAKHK